MMGDGAIRNILISLAVMRAAGILVAHSKLGGRRRTVCSIERVTTH